MEAKGAGGWRIAADLAMGFAWNLVAMAASLGLAYLLDAVGPNWLWFGSFWLYGLAILALVARQFARGRPFIALGIILAPVLVALAVGACVAIYGIPGL